ncbi:MAG: hypothetical protein E6J31_02395 [Chloroflexi bacterium]|nr:MAG: hypothetical protein E6J31_02395 [Chloroflexota bacterium]
MYSFSSLPEVLAAPAPPPRCGESEPDVGLIVDDALGVRQAPLVLHAERGARLYTISSALWTSSQQGRQQASELLAC